MYTAELLPSGNAVLSSNTLPSYNNQYVGLALTEANSMLFYTYINQVNFTVAYNWFYSSF